MFIIFIKIAGFLNSIVENKSTVIHKIKEGWQEFLKNCRKDIK